MGTDEERPNREAGRMDTGAVRTDGEGDATRRSGDREGRAAQASAPEVRYGLLGRTLGHSWSPRIHERLGSTPYQLVELEPSQLGAYVRDRGWEGLNVTIPYKRDVIALCDELAPAARRLSAVNTLVRGEGGLVCGDNTDLFGFSWLLRRFCERHLGGEGALRGAEVLVLGSGGASHAVVGALEDAGARACVISRRGDDTYDTLAERHADARLVVNATPVGMYPNCPASPLPEGTLERLGRLAGVLDVVYNPERTGICLEAERLGLPAESGLAMLVAQAWRSSELWQGRALDESLVDAIEAEIRSETRNVVLIGMPGSGKTTCGRELGRLLGRESVDLDQAFSRRFGRGAAEVIEREGEETFRAMETEVLAEHARRSGLVISCGGGVVTRPENLALARQNGTVVMLDRPLEQLSSRGRPLSRARGVAALAEERMPLYRAWADLVQPCTGSARGDAQAIARALGLR